MNTAPAPAYCTNVRPAEELEPLLADLRSFWPRVRRTLGWKELRLGLWLPAALAARLRRDPGALDSLRGALDEGGLAVTTVNAFPFGGFHAPVVKERVYRPDWRDDARVRYTIDAAHVLAGLIPEGGTATLSTLPLGYPRFGAAARSACTAALRRCAAALEQLQQTTDRRIVVALEPEPGCALERTDDAIAFFVEDLRHDEDTTWIDDHLGICLDLCHAAVAHEHPLDALRRYRSAGVPVAKVQVSAAVVVPDPTDPVQIGALEAFDEPRWLHQVGVGPRRIVDDLPAALGDPAVPRDHPWHVHFHVPLHRETVGGLPTTGPEVAEFLGSPETGAIPLECETYTWSSVPGAGDDLVEQIAAELRWTREHQC